MSKKLIALIFYFFLHSAFAQSVPLLINYQGMLTDSEGKPLANGTKKLTFNIYDEAGVKKWGPQVRISLKMGWIISPLQLFKIKSLFLSW